jgi:hypothetical protein
VTLAGAILGELGTEGEMTLVMGVAAPLFAWVTRKGCPVLTFGVFSERERGF